jgi:hypothetical protein
MMAAKGRFRKHRGMKPVAFIVEAFSIRAGFETAVSVRSVRMFW